MTRLTRDELKAEIASRKGCLVLRYVRSTGALIGLYRSAEAGIESDPTTPWATVCEDHSTLVCHQTRTSAETALPYPQEWCEDCRKVRPC
jgi:hypothetical protein